jgi:toxin HigB-1
VILLMDIFLVVLNEKIRRKLVKLPIHITTNLYLWIESVTHEGLLKVRKIPGYHDEPLKGTRKGQRSIRLSRAYRAIYKIDNNGKIYSQQLTFRGGVNRNEPRSLHASK